MKILQIFQKIVKKIREENQELIFADWTEDGSVFLLIYWDKEGKKYALSFRREESHG